YDPRSGEESPARFCAVRQSRCRSCLSSMAEGQGLGNKALFRRSGLRLAKRAGFLRLHRRLCSPQRGSHCERLCAPLPGTTVMTYRVYLTATIEIGGEFEADSWDEAAEAARQELRAQGEISDMRWSM